MKRRDLLYVLLTYVVWIACDWYFNSVLLRRPFLGKYAGYCDLTHWFLYAGLGMWAAVSESPIIFLGFFSWCFLDEFTQIFLPNRVADWLDIVRNVVGFFAGYFILDVWFQWFQWKKNKKAS